MTIKVALIGAGRMGRAAAARIAQEKDMELVAAYDVQEAEQVEGVEVTNVSGLADSLGQVKPDVVVDFTIPEASIANAKVVAESGARMVVGTTGFSDQELAELKKTLEVSGAVVAPNMSVGVNVFYKLIWDAAVSFPGYDIEVVEAHHRFKKDAPSGTALKAVDVLCRAVGRDMKKDVVYGRHGAAQRKEGQIGVHSIRAGDIVGEHTVMFSNEGERFEIRHQAHSRDSFATGIPAAVRYITNKNGIHSMGQVLGLK